MSPNRLPKIVASSSSLNRPAGDPLAPLAFSPISTSRAAALEESNAMNISDVDAGDPCVLSENELNDALSTLKRLFLALLLQETRVSDAAEKYAMGKSQTQQLQQQASSFAGNHSSLYYMLEIY